MSAVVLPFRRRARIGSMVRAKQDVEFADKRRVLSGSCGFVAGLMFDAFGEGKHALGVEWPFEGFSVVRWMSNDELEVLS